LRSVPFLSLSFFLHGKILRIEFHRVRKRILKSRKKVSLLASDVNDDCKLVPPSSSRVVIVMLLTQFRKGSELRVSMLENAIHLTFPLLSSLKTIEILATLSIFFSPLLFSSSSTDFTANRGLSFLFKILQLSFTSIYHVSTFQISSIQTSLVSLSLALSPLFSLFHEPLQPESNSFYLSAFTPFNFLLLLLFNLNSLASPPTLPHLNLNLFNLISSLPLSFGLASTELKIW